MDGRKSNNLPSLCDFSVQLESALIYTCLDRITAKKDNSLHFPRNPVNYILSPLTNGWTDRGEMIT